MQSFWVLKNSDGTYLPQVFITADDDLGQERKEAHEKIRLLDGETIVLVTLQEIEQIHD